MNSGTKAGASENKDTVENVKKGESQSRLSHSQKNGDLSNGGERKFSSTVSVQPVSNLPENSNRKSSEMMINMKSTGNSEKTENAKNIAKKE